MNISQAGEQRSGSDSRRKNLYPEQSLPPLIFQLIIIAEAINIFSITEEASSAIQELQDKPESKNLKLTLLSAGAGCGSPAIKLEMRPPLDDDQIYDTGGFTFHIRSAVSKFLDGALIEVDETFWGKQLKVKTEFGCR